MGVLGTMGVGGAVLAPCWCCFDLSLMSSQHMAAPSAPQGPARLPEAQLTDFATTAHSEKSQFPHCTVRFTQGNHISLGEPQAAPPCPAWPAATGTDGGTAPAPSAPHFPPMGDPKSPGGLASAVAWHNCPARVRERVFSEHAGLRDQPPGRGTSSVLGAWRRGVEGSSMGLFRGGRKILHHQQEKAVGVPVLRSQRKRRRPGGV